MNINDYLEGFTTITPDSTPGQPDNYLAEFTSGWANIDIINVMTGSVYDDVLAMDLANITRSALTGGSSTFTYGFNVTDSKNGIR